MSAMFAWLWLCFPSWTLADSSPLLLQKHVHLADNRQAQLEFAHQGYVLLLLRSYLVVWKSTKRKITIKPTFVERSQESMPPQTFHHNLSVDLWVVLTEG